MTTCTVCQRKAERMNSAVAECSHVDCPHRKVAWADRPEPGYTAPENFPHPLDALFERQD